MYARQTLGRPRHWGDVKQGLPLPVTLIGLAAAEDRHERRFAKVVSIVVSKIDLENVAGGGGGGQRSGSRGILSTFSHKSVRLNNCCCFSTTEDSSAGALVTATVDG